MALTYQNAYYATQARFQAATLKSASKLFAMELIRKLEGSGAEPIKNWASIIAAKSEEMTSAAGTISEANAMGALMYQCCWLADALPVSFFSSLNKANFDAIYQNEFEVL